MTHFDKCAGCGRLFEWLYFGQCWFAFGLPCCSSSCQLNVLTVENQNYDVLGREVMNIHGDEQPDDHADALDKYANEMEEVSNA